MPMARTCALRRVVLAAALAGAGLLGCREDITAPGNCPDLCPAGRVQMADTVLQGVVVSDTSQRGFVSVREASILVLANTDSLKAVGVLRFLPRATYWTTGTDTTRILPASYDSVTLSLRVSQHDTAAHDVWILVYRAPGSIDSLVTWASVQPLLADSLIIDSVRVPDSLSVAAVRALFPDSLIARMEPAPEDSGTVAIVLALRAPTQTMISVASVNLTGEPARLRWFARAADTSKVHTFDVGPVFDTFVQTPIPPEFDSTALRVGGLPSARALLRFNLPAGLIDSTRIVRASLVLAPVRAARGRPGETFTISARAVIRDFGPKSIFTSDSALHATVQVTAGDTSNVTLEMGHVLRTWRGVSTDSLPRTVLLMIEQEGQSLGEVAFARSTAGVAAAPSVRITYIKPYVFGVP